MTASPTRELHDPYLVDGSQVAAALGSDPDAGLSTTEAQRRLQADGPNELRSAPPVPTWRKIVAQFADPLVYLLLAAVVISFIVWLIQGADGVPVDVIVILVILVVNAVIGFVEEIKAADAVAALSRMTAATSTVVRDGRLHSIASAQLVRGDILMLAEGDAVGADARLLSAAGLKIQESALTGESEAVVKDPATLTEQVGVGDRAAMVHKGTAVVEGVGRAVVTATGMDTEMGAIAQLLEAAETEPSPLQVELAKVSKTLGLLVIGIAVVVMATLFVITGARTSDEVVTILLMGVSLAVAAVPEGLLAVLSLVLAIGVRGLARRNAVMKDLHSVETLGSASVICSDKTGTLTRNEMTLREVVTASGSVQLSGIGYDPDGAATVSGDDLEAARSEARVALIGGAVANNAQLTRGSGGWEIQGDPTEAAFLVAQHKLDDVAERVSGYERRGEVPFTSDRKLMSVLSHHDGRDEDRIYTKGAPDVLLQRCSSRRVGDRVEPLDQAARQQITAAIEDSSERGHRTLGVAYRVLDPRGAASLRPESQGAASTDLDAGIEQDLTFAGIVGILDPPRDEARTAVAQARGAGIRTIMITGDHPGTARRIATDLGIADSSGRVLTGADLDALDESGFAAAAREVNVFARVAPRHKLRIVDSLQADQRIVAMTGDGVNDAPALKSADIGIAMGITGTEVTKDAARMILADDNFATIVAAVRQGRVIFANIATFLRYMLSSNLGEVVAVFFGAVLGGLLGLTDPRTGAVILPLLATQILWVNLVTDTAPGLAMGVDPEIDDVMARAPRRPQDRILNVQTWLRIGWVGLLMGVVTLLTIDAHLPGGLIEGNDSVEVARTAGFTTLVLAQLFNAFCSRSLRASAFHRLFVNGWLWAAVILAVVLQVAVVHLPWLQVAFGTESMSLGQWGFSIAMASTILWGQELVKLVVRLRSRRTAAPSSPSGQRGQH